MRLPVKLFAVARERVGHSTIEVELPPTANVRQLRGAIAEQFPPLADLLVHTKLAVDNDYAIDTAELSPRSEVALIPPVSGG